MMRDLVMQMCAFGESFSGQMKMRVVL